MKLKDMPKRIMYAVASIFSRKDDEKKIIALSPNDQLFEIKDYSASDFQEYEQVLRSAFSNSKIQNIAITGNRGVGKSSIIHSYERKNAKNKYFYVSLMDFKHNFDQKSEAPNDEIKQQLQQEFERYLLCQILAKADAHSLPQSSFKLIPKKRSKLWTLIVTGLLTLAAMGAFAIAFHEVLDIANEHLKYIYIGVAGACVLPVTVLISWICKNIFRSKITANYGGIQISTEEKTKEESYIDNHIFDIVYALEGISKKIGYTVVLEDIDCLGKDICIDIFSKLRRINYIINSRNRLKGHTMRFIYAFDDSVFEITKNTKFFDYVMSVTPRLNYNTGGEYFKSLVKQSFSSEEQGNQRILNIIDGYDDEFWRLIGFVTHDYRTLNHISNDFVLFVNVMTERSFSPNKKWLPFVVYKNILADDYCYSFDNKGILELEATERNNRIQILCSDKGEYYQKLTVNLFDYICDKIGLKGRDFQEFTGLPQEVADIRDEVDSHYQFEQLLRGNVKFDRSVVGDCFKDKCILVTGGGGSIGSEICRTISKCDIRQLVIVDIDENASYEIQQELLMRYGNTLNVYIEIASIENKKRMEDIFAKYQPEIVFHAAARKHVPLMEKNPEEAIKTNILGTYNLLCVAEEYNVEKFVLISTEKAINPINVVGATKRFSEMLLKGRDSATSFSYVQFGNVIGSNGSVIPLFQRQIDNGGPIIITDKRIVRYFRTITEAVSLIIYASSIQEKNQDYVLDMGRPVKILDLAVSMIRASGLRPYEDIDIVETGLRPGEKLYQELLMHDEGLIKTKFDLIFAAKKEVIDAQKVEQDLHRLSDAIENHLDARELKKLLAEAVPTYFIVGNE